MLRIALAAVVRRVDAAREHIIDRKASQKDARGQQSRPNRAARLGVTCDSDSRQKNESPSVTVVRLFQCTDTGKRDVLGDYSESFGETT